MHSKSANYKLVVKACSSAIEFGTGSLVKCAWGFFLHFVIVYGTIA